ncbi:unnamed protein product [Linum tenue]|uniref:Uncharacterized protein n=1 Tax=Linum tenue TaxID=586396 RepID=A0AAV0IL69_9ROSI|nr:unnamed protein product [Linum tenue]
MLCCLQQVGWLKSSRNWRRRNGKWSGKCGWSCCRMLQSTVTRLPMPSN